MKLRSLIAGPIILVAAGLFLSACGQSGSVAGTAQISPAGAAASDSAQGAASSSPEPRSAPVVKAAPTKAFAVAEAGELGAVLVGANGNTLYAFTKDVDGVSTCFEACATAWPPVIVPDGVDVPKGVDPALVSTVDRPDGSRQLKVGKWPLYFFAGDGAAGDINGQGSGGVWFAEGADGKLVKGDGSAPAPAAAAASSSAASPPNPAPAAPKSSAAPGPETSADVVTLAEVGNLGEVMVGANGRTLYAFTDDPAGETTCFDACAQAWPPLTVADDFAISDELTASGASTIDRPDGSKQLVMGKWALYYYAGDAAPGDANGQGSGGKWFAIDAQCKLVKKAA